MNETERQDRINALYTNRYSAKATFKKQAIAEHSLKVKTVSEPLKIDLIDIPKLKKELFPFQKEGVSFLIAKNGRAIIGDDPGLGKTVQAIGYCQYELNCRPVLIIVPSFLKMNWATEILSWMEDHDNNRVFLLSGKTNKFIEEASLKGSGRIQLTPCKKLPKEGIFIINYDILANNKTKKIIDGRVVTKNGKPVMVDIPYSGWIDYLKDAKPEIVVLDEAHKIKTKSAGRTEATISICSKAEKIIPLTGTLIDSKPAEAFNVIKMIDPVLFKSEWLFKQRYCDPQHNGFGWSFNGATNVEELHEKLKTICIRRKKEHVLKDLPSKMRIVVPIELDNVSEYQQAERNVIDYIKRTKGKGAAEKASYAETLARLNVLKQLTIKGKLEGCLNWIENYLSTGEKLVVFCTHTATLNAVYDAFKEWSVKVDGSVKKEDRHEAVNQFQNNKKIRLFVGNIQAAGVGLTLTKAAATCTIELSWNPSEHTQAEDRVHRIGQEADHVFAYYLLAANSIELDIAELIDKKQNIVDAVLDGKSIEGSISLVDDLLNKLKGN